MRLLALSLTAIALGAGVLFLMDGSGPELELPERAGRAAEERAIQATPLDAQVDPARTAIAAPLAAPSRPAPEPAPPGEIPGEIRGEIPGEIRVRIVTSKGDPVPGLALRVQHEAAGETKGYSIQKARRQALASECGEGEVQSEAHTGADGCARFEGLAAGRYAVRTHENPWEHPSVYGTLLSGDDPVAAGGPRATIVFDRPSFSVELVDPAGAPWPGTVSAPRRFGERAPPAWPEGAHVQLVEALQTGDGWVARDFGRPSQVYGRVVPGAAVITFDVEPGEDYLLAVIGKRGGGIGFDGSPLHVRLEPDEIHRRVRIEAQPLGDFGAVEVAATVRKRSQLSGPTLHLFGEPTDPPPEPTRPNPISLSVDHGGDPDTALQLEHGSSGVILLEPEGWTASPFRFDVPPGAYRIHGRAELARPGVPLGAPHGAAHVDVQVTSFQTAIISLDVGEGGIVLVDVGEGGDSVYLELVDPSGRRMPFRWSEPAINGGASTNWWWPAGTATRSQPTPAGHYSLVGHRGFSQDGGTRYDVPVTVEDGAVVRVRLD